VSSGVQPARVGSGQWDHRALFGPSLAGLAPVSLGEGHTPVVAAPRLGAALGVPDLWLKREDVSPTGSHKARALSLQSAGLRRSGRAGALSSSGNAAIAAAAYARAADVPVLVLVSPRTPGVKLRALAAFPGTLLVTPTPIALLRRAVQVFGCEDLRPSVHPLAPIAYRGIAAELVAALGPERPPDAVFVYQSSGATAVGIAQGFAAGAVPAPALHVVTAEPAARGVGELGVGRSRRSGEVRRAVFASGGRAWQVDRARMGEVQDLAAGFGVGTSWEGVAVLTAIGCAAPDLAGRRVVALLTGELAQLDRAPAPDPARIDGLTWVETEAELDAQLGQMGLSPR